MCNERSDDILLPQFRYAGTGGGGGGGEAHATQIFSTEEGKDYAPTLVHDPPIFKPSNIPAHHQS